MSRRNLLRKALTAYAVVVALLMFAALAEAAARLLPLLIVAGIWLGWHRARHQAPRPPARPLPAPPDMSAEVVRLLAVNDQLAADNDRLRGELAEARESAAAAWDAASDRPPRPVSTSTSSRDRLVAEPHVRRPAAVPRRR